jgi:hypothetical protein
VLSGAGQGASVTIVTVTRPRLLHDRLIVLLADLHAYFRVVFARQPLVQYTGILSRLKFLSRGLGLRFLVNIAHIVQS